MSQSLYHLMRISALAAVLILVQATNTVHAQTPPIPSAADPSRVVTETPDLVQQSGAVNNEAVQAGQAYNDVVIPGADTVSFHLNSLDITGVSAYSKLYLQSLSDGLVGHDVTLQSVINVINKLNRKYRDDGFIFARAFLPEQDITEGNVRVEVVEGFVNLVQIENAVYEHSSVLDKLVADMREMRPFNIFKFERIVLQLNNLGGSKFRTLLKPPVNAVAPGGIDVVLIEDEQPDVDFLSFDNYGSKYAGPTELSFAHVKYYSFVPYDELSLQLFGSLPTDELQYFQLGYQMPVAAIPGLKAISSYSVGSTEAGSNLNELDIKGNVHEGKVGASYTYPLGRQDKISTELTLNIKTAQSKILGDPLYKDKLRVVRGSVSYEGVDGWNGASSIRAEFSQGLEILGAKPAGSENLSRADGRPDFTKFNLSCTRLQNISDNFQIFAQAQGQYTMQPLLSSEEFGFGGGSLGRGYDPSEITGDHGIGTSLEVRYNQIMPENKAQIQLIQPYAFVDFGKVWEKDNDTMESVSALSSGFGARFYQAKGFNANVTCAWPMTLSAGNPPNYSSEDGVRVLFSVSKSF